ncbi:MAG: diguanylate cyclase [Methylotenera sp.]|nr:diguanylate cyclase [Methylotenera sp.]
MNDTLAQRFRFCTTLPSIPAIAMKVIALANDPYADMVQICNQITYDPALSIKIIKAANSPLYKSRRTPENVRQAVSMLGTQAAIMIALSFAITNSLIQHNASGSISNNLFWRRTILAALAGRALAEKLHYKTPDDVFLAALLQDVGILAFDAIMPEEYAAVYASAPSHDELLATERATFGAGHDEIGFALLKRWNMPDYIAHACLTSHGQPGPKDSQSVMTACVAVSGYIADYFLTPNKEDTISTAINAAKRWLDLDHAALIEIIEIIKIGLHPVEELFDITLVHPSALNGLMDEAKELIEMHSLMKMRDLEERSQRDTLTGAYNRGYFDNALQAEFDLSNRQGLPFTIAMVDIDHFKQINDKYGHPTGDAILVAVVREIFGQIRQDDVFARYGGEEFAVLLPGTSLLSSAKLLVRLKDCVANIAYVHEDGSVIKVTVSIGVVSNMDGGERFEHHADLMRAADQALYAAKHAGRNQIVVWNKTLPSVY